MADVLAPLGYGPANDADGADMVVLNTCHIREKAAEKVYSELDGFQRRVSDANDFHPRARRCSFNAARRFCVRLPNLSKTDASTLCRPTGESRLRAEHLHFTY